MKRDISRRDFLKSSAIGVAGIAGLGILGACGTTESQSTPAPTVTPQPTAEATAPVTASTAESVVKPYGDILNPQESFTEYTTDYSALFAPLTISGKTLPNRIVKSAAGSETNYSADWPSDTSLSFYEQFAKGGVGMICGESPNVFPGTTSGIGITKSLNIYSDDNIPAFQTIADLIHQYDTILISQLYDMTMATGSSSTLNNSADLEPTFCPGIMQTTEDLHTEQQYFIEAAERLYKAGYDGIEINCSCNHYFSTFLSRTANCERTDEYSGDSLENRVRIVTEIIEGIRSRVGDDFIIQVLYSGVEEDIVDLGKNETCTTVDEACEFAKLFEKAGASCLHIRSQDYGHHCGGFMPDVLHIDEHGHTGYRSVIDYNKHMDGLVVGKYDGVGALIEVAAKIKSCVSMPVGCVGSMDPRLAPDLINNAIRDGKIDYVLVTRCLLADPSLPNKLKEGKRDEVRPCTRCMTCFVAPMDFGTPMYCRVNASLTRAYTDDMPEGYDPLASETPEKVMVIGGGPAGMEAARIAAERGHTVTLYEKETELGGTMNLTAVVKGTHERIDDHKAYLVHQMELDGVNVVTGTEVDTDLVRSEAPDAVIVAVGGLCDTPDISGADSDKVITIDDLRPYALSGEEFPVGDSIVIIGAQFQACELAVHFAKLGKKISMLNTGAESDLYMNGATWPREMGKRWLYGKGVKFYHGCVLKEITGDGVVFDTSYGITKTLPYDNVVIATPFVKNRSLFDSISEICSEVYAVGDCYAPNTIANGIARANIIARKVGSGTTATEEELGENMYTATATGIGDVTVTITVENGVITSATVDTSNETEGKGKPLGDQFAGEILSQGDVDAVSGCTVTYNAVKEALEDCKRQAGIS